MLRLREFDVRIPETLDEARAILAGADNAIVAAGGTDLIPKLKRGQFEPGIVVSLSRIAGLDVMESSKDGIRIGAGVKLRDLERWAPLEVHACLIEAVRQVATPIIRNTATLGGNLLQDTRCRYYDRGEFWREAVGYCMKKGDEDCRVAPGGQRCFASLCSDLAPALVALDAEVTLAGKVERAVALSEIYSDDGLDPVDLQGSILTEVRVSQTARLSTYRKLRMRGSFDFPEVGLAVVLSKDKSAIHASIAVSGVSSGIVHVRKSVAPDGAEDLVNEVYTTIKPMDTLYFAPAYRKNVTRNLLRQALDDLLSA